MSSGVTLCLNIKSSFARGRPRRLDQNFIGVKKYNKNEISTLPKLNVFLEDCEDLFYVNIKGLVIGYLNKLRKLFSDYFLD